MPFRVTYEADLGCILAELSGDIDKELVSGFFAEVLRIVAESGCNRLLTDVRDARIKATTADIYWMAEALAEKSHALRRRAIVVARDREDYDFWETVCANQGHRTVRTFEDYEEAKRWALEAG